MVDTEQRVDEAMLCLTMDTADVISTGLPTDRREEELISEFMTSGCGCTKERGVRNAANSLVWIMSDHQEKVVLNSLTQSWTWQS